MGYRHNHRTSSPQSSLPLVVVALVVGGVMVVVAVAVAVVAVVVVVVVVVGDCACWQHKIGEIVDWPSPTAARETLLPD